MKYRINRPDTGSKHKYGAKRTEVDGITFASKAEAKRYQELKLLEKAGEINGLVLQPRFPLYVCGEEIGKYIADFSYLKRGETIHTIEDVKGMRTPQYRWKRKHFQAQYGLEITEITR